MTDHLDTIDEFDSAALARFLSGESSHAEAEAIQQWANADAARRARVESLRVLWEEAKARRQRFDLDAMWKNISAQMEPLAKRAVLTAVHTPRCSIGIPAPRVRWWSPVGAVAAALVVAAAGVLWHTVGDRHGSAPTVAMREVATAKGQRASIRLSDGTRVLLGVDSKLRFAKEFGEHEREVYLEGEGYFEVTHDADDPFVVHTNGAEVKDLGTEFDVRAYGTDTAVRVVVVSGKVSLYPTAQGTASGPVLTRGQLGQVDRNSQRVTVEAVDPHLYIAWREGRLVFQNTPLSDVLAQLHRWYDVDFQIADSSIAWRPLTASFQGETIGEVLRFVAVALDVRYERQGQTITLSLPVRQH